MNRVLVILDNFAPQNNCGSIPNTKLLKYLARQDLDITLVTKAITPDMDLDEDLVPAELIRVRVLRVNYGSLFAKTIQASRNRITASGVKAKMKAETRPLRSAVVSILKGTYFGLRNRDWVRQALTLIDRELGDQTFDCVYSSYPEGMSHALARKLLACGRAKRWVADFRDPMFYDFYDSHGQKRKRRRQHRYERLAHAVTIVSEDSIDKFRCDGVPDSKITVIPNGYDPEDFTPAPAAASGDRILRIFYAGTLYAGKRDFTVLFRALSELIREGLVDPDRVAVEYAGNEWAVMEAFAAKFGLEHICRNYGYIPRTRVLELLSRCDCCAVSSHNTHADRGVVTGKIFEQLMMEKPIITVISGDVPNSELGRIVRSCKAGVVYEEPADEQDYPPLKQWLLDTYREKQSTGAVHFCPDRQAREQYSYEHLSCRLRRLMLSEEMP